MYSKRLTFREIGHSDAARIAEYAGDWDVARMTARIPFPYSERLAREWMQSIEADEFVRGVLFQGDLIGAVGFVSAEDGSAEIGYWIGKPWWGRGFATEAATALVHYCFTAEKFTRLTSCHFIDNEASARVIAKLGFKRSGTSTVWCDARQADVPVVAYERRRPLIAKFWRRAA